MRPLLVATDLDGTFLGAEGMVHPGNLEAAREVHAAGIELVIATGRPRRNLAALSPLLDIDPILIASNGASIGRLGAQEPDIIHPMDADTVLEFARGLPADLEAVFGVEYVHDWGVEEHFPHIPDRQPIVATLEELVAREPIIKFLVHTRRANTEELAEVVFEAAGEGLTPTFSWAADHGTVEISAPGVTKGAALAEVIAELGIDPADCAAFGDMPNDLEMLRLVGGPFVMANAHPSMFEHGFTVIGPHHEGAVGQQWRSYLV
ncbi:Cof-type HAD-IIB family hydrolase [Tessaracoccus sp. OS52]|uniref:HAD-IIB family hydrolase n=1 Tax=Tessaracoccus sp. OS52 TaxID=2886691 RepID=UPI001D127D8F|nr:HAD family hydrolase [Tessaracoccus sp. OS52]MCC2592739.1 Cof-type HAD-IIB family hydrolase [Tessaracoccus sp. OS52]